MRSGKSSTNMTIKKKKSVLVKSIVYPNGKKMNAGVNGILDRIQTVENKKNDDQFVNEFEMPSPGGPIGIRCSA